MFLSICKVLLPSEIESCLEIRQKVFVVGQNVPLEEEVDGKDSECEHYLLKVDGVPTGVARIRYPYDHIAKIERVAILTSHQGLGLGLKMMTFIMSDIKNKKNVLTVKLSSQSHSIDFYKKLGFSVCSEEYLDAGILHRDMELIVEN